MTKRSLVEVYKEVSEVVRASQWQYLVVGQGLIEQCALGWL